MIELGINVSDLIDCFEHEQDEPYVLIRVSNTNANNWANLLRVPLRRCYITDENLIANSERTGLPQSDVILSKLPDPGSVMSGDFGEILTYLYHATQTIPNDLIGPKKWRLKQDRTKAAPFSDVVQFVVPDWPTPSSNDKLLCSEVKAKATNGTSKPIESAISDCKKDITSRLAKTLNWLKERAINEDLGSTTIELLDRYIHAVDHPPVQKYFRAVAVICASLVDAEILDSNIEVADGYTVVIISVPDLKSVYEAVFGAASITVAGSEAVL